MITFTSNETDKKLIDLPAQIKPASVDQVYACLWLHVLLQSFPLTSYLHITATQTTTLYKKHEIHRFYC